MGRWRQKAGSEFEQRFGGLNANLELGYAVQQFFLNGGQQAWVVRVARQLSAEKVIKGIRALDGVEIFNLLVMPGVTDTKTLFAAADYCQKRRAFLIVDAPRKAKTPDQVRQWIESEAAIRSPNAAAYYPWIKIADPLNGNKPRLTAPSGTVAGLYSRIDSTRGVWKTPAGVEANLVGVQSLDYIVTDVENGVLNQLGVNALRVFAGRRARSLGRPDIADCRFFRLGMEIHLSSPPCAVFGGEHRSRHAMGGVRTERRTALGANPTCATRSCTIFSARHVPGDTPARAYFVKCDERPLRDRRQLGIVNIGWLRPTKPAEFVVLKIQQKAGQVAK